MKSIADIINSTAWHEAVEEYHAQRGGQVINRVPAKSPHIQTEHATKGKTASERTIAARAAIERKYPSEYGVGLRAGFIAGGYPDGFHSWPVDRKDAFYAGFNAGRCDRLRAREGRADG